MSRRSLRVLLLIIAVMILIIIYARSSRRAVQTANIVPNSPVLIIDAGHGGMDGGAVAASGVKESEINLSVSQTLCSVCRFFGADCLMTRSSETLDYPPNAVSIREKKVWDLKRRVEMANGTNHAFLISIHQNLYPDPRPSGAQVIYADTDGSAEFAIMTHDNLRRCLCPDSRRVAAPATDAIYLMKNVRCPAILVECGFLSNPDEAARLTDPYYQKEIAMILCASYFQFLNS